MTRRAARGERRADIDPEPIDAALDRYTRSAGLSGDLALAKIRAVWVDVVGPMLAGRCRADRLQGDVLRIWCDHGATANEIAMLETAIARAATEAGGRPVTSLSVTVRRRVER